MKLPAALLILGLAATLACARQAERCWVCDREIHSQVRVTMTLENGKRVVACCPRCALHYKEEPGHGVRDIHVTDYASGVSLGLERAFLVEGSDETPCVHPPPVVDDTRSPMQICYDRCMPSLIAFRDVASAGQFVAAHGGALRQPGALPGVATASAR